MSVHMQRELDAIKRMVMALSALVENRFQQAVKALHTRDESSARQVIDNDWEIDNAEVEVEEACLKILALHQPVARDLRFIVAVLKITNDLERIGDLAVNLSRKALALAGQTEFQFPFDLAEMSREAQSMLRDSLDCLANLDAPQARQVCLRDSHMNRMKRAINAQAEEEFRRQPNHIRQLLKLLGAVRNLERVADLATNIAEDVVYMVDGHIIRHQGEWEAAAGER